MVLVVIASLLVLYDIVVKRKNKEVNNIRIRILNHRNNSNEGIDNTIVQEQKI